MKRWVCSRKIQRILAVLLLLIFALVLKNRFPQAVDAIKPVLFGQEDSRAVQAFSSMTDAMQSGPGFGDAVHAFYLEMTTHEIP